MVPGLSSSKLLQSLLPNHKSDDKDQDLLGARQLGPLHLSIQLILKNPVSLGMPAKLQLQIKKRGHKSNMELGNYDFYSSLVRINS